MSADWMVHTVILLIVIGIIAGLLYWLVQRAPFIPEPFKSVIGWIILAFCVLFLIYAVLLPLVGGAGEPLLRR